MPIVDGFPADDAALWKMALSNPSEAAAWPLVGRRLQLSPAHGAPPPDGSLGPSEAAASPARFPRAPESASGVRGKLQSPALLVWIPCGWMGKVHQ